jgi:hypothetical protein
MYLDATCGISEFLRVHIQYCIIGCRMHVIVMNVVAIKCFQFLQRSVPQPFIQQTVSHSAYLVEIRQSVTFSGPKGSKCSNWVSLLALVEATGRNTTGSSGNKFRRYYVGLTASRTGRKVVTCALLLYICTFSAACSLRVVRMLSLPWAFWPIFLLPKRLLISQIVDPVWIFIF